MLADASSFQVLGLSLEELAAEKVLGWASKDLPKHYIDLAYIARNHASTMSLDRSGELIVEKFERELPGITVFSSDLITEIPHPGWA
jgi:hypothetical protein